MNKIILFIFVFILSIVDTYWYNINIKPWETRLISFSQELESISFSKTTDISIRTLESWIWKDLWIGVNNFIPLTWYVFSNSNWEDLNIEYINKKNIVSSNSLLQRKLLPWWNLIWISWNNEIWKREKIESILWNNLA